MMVNQENGSTDSHCANHSTGLHKTVHIGHSTAFDFEDATGGSGMDCNYVYVVESLTLLSTDLSVTKVKSAWTLLNAPNNFLFVSLPSDRPPRL
jgi:hypothetical protein